MLCRYLGTAAIALWGLAAVQLIAPRVWAQAAKAAPDEIVFVNGERLLGHIERSNGASVVFKSDMLGEITVDWSKIGQLHSTQAYAVIPKNVELKKNADTSAIPQGAISVTDQKITVTPGTGQPRVVATSDSEHVIAETTFQNAVAHTPRFYSDWRGGITAGAALIQATQQSRAYNATIGLVRTTPDEDWLRRRNRTTIDFSTAYGTVKQPATPTVKTDVYHAGIERDEYVSASMFGFGQALFDHNFSQGLDLQETFGGGVGWSVIKRPNESLDAKAGITFIRQNFTQPASNQNLAASTFEEDFRRGLRRGVVFTERLVVTPAWNNTNAISAMGTGLLTMPVYKRMNFSLGVINNYLHDPPPGFKKNSLQTTAGFTYRLR